MMKVMSRAHENDAAMVVPNTLVYMDAARAVATAPVYSTKVST
jgi:hypothetical protein